MDTVRSISGAKMSVGVSETYNTVSKADIKLYRNLSRISQPYDKHLIAEIGLLAACALFF